MKIFSGLTNPINIFSDYPINAAELNSLGFRSEEFGLGGIVFAGCSETFGCGGTIENTWAHILNNRLNSSHYYNLGMPGAGFQDIINTCVDYINKYVPETLFVLFPDMERMIGFYQDRYIPRVRKIGKSFMFHSSWLDDEFISDNSPKFTKYSEFREFDYFNLFVTFLLAIKMFENFCKSNNVKLYWGTWVDESHSRDSFNLNKHIQDYLVKNEGEINNYVYVAYKDIKELKDDVINTGLSFVKDDGHLGSVYHKHWADRFELAIRQQN